MGIDDSTGFVKASVSDVEVGKPLRYPLYDGNRKLLLKRGYIVESVRQCELLVERGLYRNINERSAPPVTSASPSAAEAAAPSRESITTLDETKLRIGDPLILQSSADAPRLVVKLIGYLKNAGLIVTVPGSDGEFIMLKEGQSFIVRFFSGQNAYAFTSAVSKQTSVPFPHVHLSYPREVRALEIRKGSRIDVELIAAIGLSGEGENESLARSGKIFNLSTGGAALRSKALLGKKGDVISVKFKVLINDIQSYLTFDSIIRAVTHEPAEAMPHVYGLQFESTDQNMSLALTAFVYQKMIDESR